ncbi:response regulator transcription factor [Frankia sp. Cj5]|uniref:LuxR C-terminal-related transcriptional regulator n=1 Tax=Frankia sp. Cj5 TaxID=2880978 RepID=UPI001EF744FB|nr:response regulator transcription factor [Frankia sp. Cj5]
MRVIVAEDSGFLSTMIAEGLTERGVDVVGVARTAQALLDLTESAQPDIVTLDLSMPRGQSDSVPEQGVGLEVARAIRRTNPRIALLAVSQYGELPWVEEIIRLGPRTGYLLKDRIEDLPELINTMRAVMEGDTKVDPSLIVKLVERKRHNDRIDRLTPREREVFTLVAHGYSDKAIAKRLHLSQSAVEGHVRSIYRKLEISVVASPDSAGQTDDLDSRNRRVMATLTYLRWGRSE